MSFVISHGELEVLKMSSEAVLPTRAHPNDAGLDLYCLEDAILAPEQGKTIRSGIAIAIPDGFVGLITDRSSLAKKGIKTAGGIIDAGYRGEIHVILWNISTEEIRIQKGERMAQLLIMPIATPAVKEVTNLNTTSRGDRGFGSTGR